MSQTPKIPQGSMETQLTWSHEDVVAHRLATGVKTLSTVKTPIESHLDDFFEERSNQKWAFIVKQLARTLPHGHYDLKPEKYGMLKPEIYPFEDEAGRHHVIRLVQDYKQPTQTQGLVRKPRRKRNLVIASDDEEELHGAAKKSKPNTEASMPQESASDTSSAQSQSEPCHSLDTAFTLPSSNNLHNMSKSIDQELESDHDLEVKVIRNSSLLKEIDILTRNKSKLKARIEDVDNLKSTARHLQRKVAEGRIASRSLFEKSWTKSNEQQSFIQEKDKQIKHLRSSNSEKDLQIVSLQEDLRKAKAIVQHLTNAIRALQTQQQLAERQAQIEELSFQVAQEKYTRATAERKAKEADQRYFDLLNSTGVEYRRAIAVQQQLKDAKIEIESAKNELKSAQLREETTLAEDEKKLQERRAAMKQRQGPGDGQLEHLREHYGLRGGCSFCFSNNNLR